MKASINDCQDRMGVSVRAEMQVDTSSFKTDAAGLTETLSAARSNVGRHLSRQEDLEAKIKSARANAAAM